MSDKLKAVLVGCGSISNAWMQAIKDINNLEMVGFVDINEDAAVARRDSTEFKNAPVGTDMVAMLKDVKPDAVFDCTVPEAHTPVTITALEYGCHVLGEKPMADSMENARNMVEAAQKSGKTYAVIQNRRYQPEIRAFREFIASGKVGELTTLNSDFYIGAHFQGFRNHMKHVLILDMAIHSFDAARYIMNADPVAVYCMDWNPKGSWYDQDASAVAIFEMSNGIVYTYRGSWCSEGLRTTWECDWRAIGVNGSVTWDGASAFHAQALDKAEGASEVKDIDVPVPEGAKSGGHAGVIKEFVDCVLTGKTPETICTDNIKSLAMVFGAIESSETGKRVLINI